MNCKVVFVNAELAERGTAESVNVAGARAISSIINWCWILVDAVEKKD